MFKSIVGAASSRNNQIRDAISYSFLRLKKLATEIQQELVEIEAMLK